MYRPAEAASRVEASPEPFPPTETPKKTGRLRRWLIAIGALLAVVFILAFIKYSQINGMIKAGKAMVPPPESVTAIKAQAADWRPVRSAVGTLVAVRAVVLSAEIVGAVREIAFENGSLVKKGQLLIRMDTSAEEAQLEGALADQALAKQTLERTQRLRKENVNTMVEVEAAEARALQTKAVVDNLRALIAKKVIHAPFDGRVGIRQVELGQVLSSGNPIVSLQTVSPIYAEFQLPQQALADVKLGQKVAVKVDVFPDASWDGIISTINPEVDPSTRNVRMRATVDNKDGRLNPGMYASVDVFADHTEQVLTVPATAVLFAPYGDSIYVVEESKGPDGKTQTVAKQRFVRVGERRGDFVAVVSGLKPDETVVSNGAFKVKNGMSVSVKNDTAPAQLNPTPVDR
jgi:membrane fusion protein (multidrug efflux system)